MKTTTARQPKSVKVAKPAYKPHVLRESATSYTVQSEKYVYVLYTVTVADDGSCHCNCTAGSFGRTCKHQKIVAQVVAYNAHPCHIRPMVEATESAAPVLAAPIDLAARRAYMTAPTVVIPAIDSFMEIYG